MNTYVEPLDDTLPESETLTANGAAHELLSVLYRDPALWTHVTLTADEMPEGWRHEFVALRQIWERGEALTRAVLAEELKALTGRVRGINDERITTLAFGGGSAKNLDRYQRILRRAARLRRVMALQRELDDCLRQGDPDAAMQVLHRVLTDTPGSGGGVMMREVLQGVLERMEKPPEVVPLGFAPLDHLLAGGLRPGEVMVLAARPSVGKSATLLQMILSVAENVGPVALWTLEMSVEQWTERALATEALVSSERMRRRQFLDDDYPRLATAAARINRLPIYFADTTDTTPEGWRLEASRAVREFGVKLLAVDYLGLLQPPKGAWSRENEVSTHSRNIKTTALELGVPVVLLHQLNREADDRPPTLRNLRESGAIEQDADQVLFIHRDRDRETTLLRREGVYILAKQREGPTGVIPVEYDDHHYRFLAVTDREPPSDLDRHRGRMPYMD